MKLDSSSNMPYNIIMDMKRCSRCKKVLPTSEFWKKPSTKDGLMYWCKNCRKANKKWARRYYRLNPKAQQEATKRWLLNHPEYREKMRKLSREWMRSHPEVGRRNQKKWYHLHSKEHYAWRSNYIKNHRKEEVARTLAGQHFPILQPCSIAGCKNMGERHHEDYDKPLEITWLCKSHHKRLHKPLLV